MRIAILVDQPGQDVERGECVTSEQRLPISAGRDGCCDPNQPYSTRQCRPHCAINPKWVPGQIDPQPHTRTLPHGRSCTSRLG